MEAVFNISSVEISPRVSQDLLCFDERSLEQDRDFWHGGDLEGWEEKERYSMVLDGYEASKLGNASRASIPEAQSLHPSSTSSSDESLRESKHHSNKLTNTTQDTHAPVEALPQLDASLRPRDPPKRQIFLVSKLVKRQPRRSFDLHDLKCLKDLDFLVQSIPSKTEKKAEYLVDKQKLADIYNQSVDQAVVPEGAIASLSLSEKSVLQEMLLLRFEGAKAVKDRRQLGHLLSDQQLLQQLLQTTRAVKKRTEELLKKNFKTVLKMMLEDMAEHCQKFASKSQSEKHELFAKHYFDAHWQEHTKVFKCIQMSQDFYSAIFSFESFKRDFKAALANFIDYFKADRIGKTINLIGSIVQEQMTKTKTKSSLRTPWSVLEAQASLQQMLKLL